MWGGFGLIGFAITWKVDLALRCGSTLVGGGAGAVLAMYANTAGLHKVDDAHPNLPFYILVAGLTVIGMVVTTVAHRYGTCVGLAIMGSFAFVRGIGVFVGGFVDPITFVNTSGPAHNNNIVFWVYVAAIPVLAVLSSIWQCVRLHRKLLQEEEDKDEYLAHAKLFDTSAADGGRAPWYDSSTY